MPVSLFGFFKKSPKRLYYPVKSHWYTRPRRETSLKISRKVFFGNVRTHFTRLFKNAFYFVLTGGAIALIFLVLFFSSYFSITNIQVVRQDFFMDSAAIENQLNEFIGKNIIFFSESRVVYTIQQNFPEFESIEVNKVLPHTLKIKLQNYPIVANLKAFYTLPKKEAATSETPEQLINPPSAEKPITGERDSAQATGQPATPAPPAEQVVINKQVLDNAFVLNNPQTGSQEDTTPIEQKSLLNRIGQAIFGKEENLELMTVTVVGLTQPIGDRQQVIAKPVMDFMMDSIQYFNNLFKTQIKAVEYRPEGREIHLKTEKGFEVWLTLEKDYKEQIDKLNTIYETAELNKENLSYVDLRVREKVIYCLRGTACDKE